MATAYTQADRPLQITTPLGKDVLLLTGLTGREALSRLYVFQVDLVAGNDKKVPFEQLLGQPLSIRLALPGKKQRHFHGICSRISQGERDTDFTTFRAEIVPQFWLLTRTIRSRIFQHQSIPDILKKVLAGLDVSWEIQGSFPPRNFCVQYRESDFHFASRLMEEEGIYYYFKHSESGHKLVVANTPASHADIPDPSQLLFEPIQGGNRPENRINTWSRLQELRSGKVTLWDHCFELPHKHLEADRTIQDSVAAGKVTHQLKVAGNDRLEIYDWPGGYTNRFDGIDPSGGERPTELQKIFEDNQRTAQIRMQEEALHSLAFEGSSNCGQLGAGHKFTLQNHFDADGVYVLTEVAHVAQLGDYRSAGGEFSYENHFTCIPLALPFRPPRTTPKPVVRGSQTAVVVGPPGEEIFTDKYGRVKVQFHWDRDGQHNADSSCWIRVGTPWAGKQWGMIHIPRIGQEVIVDFLEGDPDRPIIIGSVYNADMMPPYELPAHKTQSGIKTRSSMDGTLEDFNEICFEDKKGEELLYIRAQKDQTIAVENDEAHWVGHDRLKTIDNDETVLVHHDRTETVDHNETITIHNCRTETVDVNETITIGANRAETVGANESVSIGSNRTHTVGGNEVLLVALTRTETVGGNQAIMVGGAQETMVGGARSVLVGGAQTLTVGGGLTEAIGGAHATTVGGNQNTAVGGNRALKVGGSLVVDAGSQISLVTGGASILMKKDGTITIKGKNITLEASGKVHVKAGGNVTLKGSKILEN